MDQRFLDLMGRVEQTQQDLISEINRRLDKAERQNSQLKKRLTDLESLIKRQETALSTLNPSLARFLDPLHPPPSLDMSRDVTRD